MKKTLLLLVAALTVLGAAAGKKTRFQGSRIFWDSKSPVTIFQSTGYARVIELADGRLMACGESWNKGVAVAYSTNMGKSWGASQIIMKNENNVPNCVPDLIQLTDGTLIVAYNPRPSKPYTEDRRYSIRLKRSTDNGKTWGDEIVVYDADYVPESGCWEPSLLELPSGELQLYFADESPYTGSNTDQQISVCRSFDGGQTWSKPDCVSYRKGFRDGMPVPILLKDGATIAVAIEDNGWGVNDFLPTIVKNTVARNWKTYVNESSTQRQKAVNYAYCPAEATGGAPYLRMLPNGETVLSHQTTYKHDGCQAMYVYVGSEKAANFKGMSCPFAVPKGQKGLWNSVAVIDTGVVVAVSGFSGNVYMVKGWPKTQFEARYATPVVDGKRSTTDGYYAKQVNQVMMGGETGTFSYSDFAYDQDSLYFFTQVFDSKVVDTFPYGDYVSLSVETAGASYDTPQKTSYRYYIVPGKGVSAHRGNGAVWLDREDECKLHQEFRRLSQYYFLEVAIPWSDMGLTEPPVGSSLLVNLNITNGDGTSDATEYIPDAKDNEPWTWMTMHLHAKANEDAIQVPMAAAPRRQQAFDLSGRPVNAAGFRGIYVQDGKKIIGTGR